jgi:5-methyltetrahydrofolate--homocysteine methyltransferase
MVKPKMTREAGGSKAGKVVLGTVKGDIHDIGKNIVAFVLDLNGFEVYDLGVDVPPEKFIEKIRQTNAPIVALSGFLTLAFDEMKATVEAIEKAGLRDKVKIIIGGGNMNEEIKVYSGADAYGVDAMAAVTFAEKVVASTR